MTINHRYFKIPFKKNLIFLSIKLKNIENKNWAIRMIALVFTMLCSFTLYDVGEPRPYHISIPRGILNSLILNTPLWLASIKWVRVKLKYLIALMILLSSVGVFLATPWGWTIAILSLIFHLWLIYALVTSSEELWIIGLTF